MDPIIALTAEQTHLESHLKELDAQLLPLQNAVADIRLRLQQIPHEMEKWELRARLRDEWKFLLPTTDLEPEELDVILLCLRRNVGRQFFEQDLVSLVTRIGATREDYPDWQLIRLQFAGTSQGCPVRKRHFSATYRDERGLEFVQSELVCCSTLPLEKLDSNSK